MSLTLTVDTARWQAHVAAVAAAVGPGLIPVIKGNGYGVGRASLATYCADLGRGLVAVGTVHETVEATAAGLPVLVLTPTLDDPGRLPDSTVLTVGDPVHVAHLERCGWNRPVVVKLASSMRRYGFDDAPQLSIPVAAYGLHLPLAGTDDDRLAEIDRWLARLDPVVPVHLSHLSPDAFRGLADRHPQRRFSLRLGTSLWHGDKSAFHLTATVLGVRPVRAGDRAGYRQGAVATDGHLVLVGAGTAHGVVPLDGGLSPLHYARKRLALVEAPHMHTSMALVPDGDPVPGVGEQVDVQRPLTQVLPDAVIWR